MAEPPIELIFHSPRDTRIIEGKNSFHSFEAASVSRLLVSGRTIDSLPSTISYGIGAALSGIYTGSLCIGMLGTGSLIPPLCNINIITLARCGFRGREPS